MTIVVIIFIVFLVVSVLWIVTTFFDFTTISISAKTASRLGDLTVKMNDWDEQRRAYGALNSRIHAEASYGMKCVEVYVKRKYVDLFEKRLRRRGFQVEREDGYEWSTTVRLIIEW
jgi:hypothetical protein